MSPVGFVDGRYQLPNTAYFSGTPESQERGVLPLRNNIPIKDIAIYAQRRRLVDLLQGDPVIAPEPIMPWAGAEHYSPPVAEDVERARERGDVDEVTNRWEVAGILTNGRAPLGLPGVPEDEAGNPKAGMALPIMWGKQFAFFASAYVRAVAAAIVPKLRLEQRRALEAEENPEIRRLLKMRFEAENLAYITVTGFAPWMGFINFEDVNGEMLPFLDEALRKEGMDVGSWSDDRKGTGGVAGTGTVTWAYFTGRLIAGEFPLAGIRKAVIVGAGAGALGVFDEWVNNGLPADHIRVFDTGPKTGPKGNKGSGGIYPLDHTRIDLPINPLKWKMAQHVESSGSFEEEVRDADIVVNLATREFWMRDLAFTERWLSTLAPQALVLALTNPDPGMTQEWLRRIRNDLVFGSGDNTRINPLNNFEFFPSVGWASLRARARSINSAMTRAGVIGGFKLALEGPPSRLIDRLPRDQREPGLGWLVPRADDPRLIRASAVPMSVAGYASGVSQFTQGRIPSPAEVESFQASLEGRIARTEQDVADLVERSVANRPRYFAGRYKSLYAPFHIGHEGWDVPLEVEQDRFSAFAEELGIDVAARNIENVFHGGVLRANALTLAMERLQEEVQMIPEGRSTIREIAQRELLIILRICIVYPSLGLALACRSVQTSPSTFDEFLTIFHHPQVAEIFARAFPEDHVTISGLREWTAELLSTGNGAVPSNGAPVNGGSSTNGGRGTYPAGAEVALIAPTASLPIAGEVTEGGGTPTASAGRNSLISGIAHYTGGEVIVDGNTLRIVQPRIETISMPQTRPVAHPHLAEIDGGRHETMPALHRDERRRGERSRSHLHSLPRSRQQHHESGNLWGTAPGALAIESTTLALVKAVL